MFWIRFFGKPFLKAFALLFGLLFMAALIQLLYLHIAWAYNHYEADLAMALAAADGRIGLNALINDWPFIIGFVAGLAAIYSVMAAMPGGE
ncbi:hypothetical protein [Endozoicomonas sp. 2B-B]